MKRGCDKKDCGRLKGYYPNGDTWYCDECENKYEDVKRDNGD